MNDKGFRLATVPGAGWWACPLILVAGRPATAVKTSRVLQDSGHVVGFNRDKTSVLNLTFHSLHSFLDNKESFSYFYEPIDKYHKIANGEGSNRNPKKLNKHFSLHSLYVELFDKDFMYKAERNSRCLCLVSEEMDRP